MCAIVHNITSFADLINKRKLFEELTQQLGIKSGSVTYGVAMLYLYNLLVHVINFLNYKMRIARRHGIDATFVKEIIPFEDRFEVKIVVQVKNIDAKKILKDWYTVTKSIRMSDDEFVRRVWKMGLDRFIKYWTEMELEAMEARSDELKEFKVVYEEPVKEGENS
jgi:hypothetical protein